ncbi:PREDICTED: protein HUA2-LIKE 1-like [Camelina sativa]|uniref:Protein HUA2-LIKE 1-like n=1 Tax=Camelina sativa TaxID=90675 RepID=A0ABM0V958_CAMSA|nr:PREDICTED: protein HUA2-LIKE 1-like [Camelina sativa]XP_010452801.1 PREDICTED: protein HUA2-LIKE 1-like [Camelina sativa]XP_010452802.1 PREDICTED: protein HUA2-LIKE 1-like [Camelina sativa]
MAPGRKRGANKALAIGDLRLGDLVLAKIKGFPAWPAKISRPEDWKQVPDPKKHFVYFFGTQEIGFVTPPDIQVFTTEAKDKLLQKCKGKTVKYFAQAVEEISAAFEESQIHKSDILDPAVHDGKSDKFDSRSDPCPGKLVEDNGAETKPGLGEQDPSKSNDRTTSQSSEPVEHGSLDPILKVADSRDKTDGVTCTDHGKNSANGQRIIKKTAGDTKKRSKDEVHRAKRVPDNRAATDSHLLGQKKGNKKGQEHGSKIESFDNKVVLDVKIASSKKSKELLKEKPIARVCGEILEKKKKFESKLGKSASGVDDSERAAKRPRSEDAKDQKQCKRKHLLPVSEGKAEVSDSTGVVSSLKPETVLGAQGGKNQFDKEAVAYTKRRKETVEHTSVSSFSRSLNKEGTNHPEKKITSSSDSDVKVPAAQLPKRRRAVCIYDDDDDDEDPKTPVHGGHTNVPKAKLASTGGPKSAYASHDTSIKVKLLAGSAESAKTGKVHLYQQNKKMEGYNSPMGKPVKAFLPKNIKPNLSSPKNSHQLVSFKKQVTGQNKTPKVSGSGMPDSVEGPSNSSSVGKPFIELPPQNVKQIFRSPNKSSQLFSTMEQVAGQNKVTKVSGVGIPKKCQGDFSKDAMAGSDILSSSHSETTNQRSKPALEENPTGTPKVATCLNDVGVSTGISVNLSADIITGNQENGSATLISSSMPDSSSSMKHLIAAAQEKRKQAHSHTSPIVNIDHNSFTIDPMQTSQSPFMVQNVSSSAGDAMLIVAEEPQEDSTPSIHGHQSSSSNQVGTEEKEERRFSSGHRSVEGSLSGATEAAISRDTFEGMLETLSRTKESIGRATRMAINCAEYGIASEVVELLIRKLEIEPHFRRKVDLFFLVDSITQCSHKQKGKTGGLYIPTVQAALPRLLGAAAPPGTGARENRHQCRKVLRLWLKRKIFPDSLLRRYIGDIGASGDDKTVGFSLRRPSRSERSVDDPLRDMEGMLVDEYGSNASFQLAGFLSSHNFGDDEEDEDLPSTSHEVKNTHIEEPVHALGKLEAHDSSSDKPHCVVDVSGVREMEDASCQLTDDVPSYVCGIGAKEDSPAATYATEIPPFPACSPSLPHESPPSPPPLPPSPPPLSPPPPPSYPSELPFAPPPSDHFFTPPPAPLALPPSSQSIALTRPSMPSHPSLLNKPGFTNPAHASFQHEYQISMQWNQQLRPSNTSFLQRPVIRNLAPAPSSHFPFPSLQSEPQRSSFPHPYPFPSQSVDGQRHMNEEAWRMSSNGRNADTLNGAWISGRNPFPGSLTVTDGFFQPPPERPSGTMSYQFAADNVQGGPTITGHGASQMLPSRPDVPFTARWRPP